MDSTLALSLNELEGEIGWNQGYGRGAANGEAAWSARQQADIDAYRRAGLRAFYTASAGQDDGTQGYPWSFLRPLVTLTLASGATLVALPEDYHGIEGRITASASGSSTQVRRQVPVVGIGLILESYGKTPSLTGWPQMAAIRPLKCDSAIKGQRFQLYVFPTADQEYSLQFTYWISPGDIDAARPFPYGGAQHSETIIAACLAAAEQKGGDMAGVQTLRYAQLLTGSIMVDKRNQPQLGGYCGDHSDHGAVYGDGNRRREIYDNESITFNGSAY